MAGEYILNEFQRRQGELHSQGEVVAKLEKELQALRNLTYEVRQGIQRDLSGLGKPLLHDVLATFRRNCGHEEYQSFNVFDAQIWEEIFNTPLHKEFCTAWIAWDINKRSQSLYRELIKRTMALDSIREFCAEKDLDLNQLYEQLLQVFAEENRNLNQIGEQLKSTEASLTVAKKKFDLLALEFAPFQREEHERLHQIWVVQNRKNWEARLAAEREKERKEQEELIERRRQAKALRREQLKRLAYLEEQVRARAAKRAKLATAINEVRFVANPGKSSPKAAAKGADRSQPVSDSLRNEIDKASVVRVVDPEVYAWKFVSMGLEDRHGPLEKLPEVNPDLFAKFVCFVNLFEHQELRLANHCQTRYDAYPGQVSKVVTHLTQHLHWTPQEMHDLIDANLVKIAKKFGLDAETFWENYPTLRLKDPEYLVLRAFIEFFKSAEGPAVGRPIVNLGSI